MERKDDKDEKKDKDAKRSVAEDTRKPAVPLGLSRAPSTGRVVRYKTSFKNTILDLFKLKGWKEAESDMDWDVLWYDRVYVRDLLDHQHLEPHQRVNHFRNHYELTRKDLLAKNLKRAKRLLTKEGSPESKNWEFFPETFVLPAEYAMFVEAFKQNPCIWIMKPIAKSQGKGVFLISKLNQINDWRNDYLKKSENPKAELYIVQQYVANPYLLCGKKFDLRVYALVSSYNPLTIYLHRSGFARCSTQRFTMNMDSISETYIHITNVAVQKKAPGYDAETGGKIFMNNLKQLFIAKHGFEKTNKMFLDISMIIVRSLMSVQKIVISDKHCFELYGYDVLIDDTLKPWLLEVNASPSLTANTHADWQHKVDMLDDLMKILGFDGELTGNEEQVGGFDLIYKNGMVKFDKNCTMTTYLGCHDNREVQLKRLSKQLARQKQEGASAKLQE